MSRSVPLWIEGQDYHSETTVPLKHPNTSKHVHDVHVAGERDLEAAVESASKAFPSWSQTSIQERRRILQKAATLLREQVGRFKDAWQAEMEVSDMFAGFNATTSADMIEEVAANMTLVLQGEIARPEDSHNTYSFITREPFGVCLALTPWNAALILSIRAIATPIAAGNTVVVRTSEVVPYTQYLWGPLFAEAGLPAGVLNIVHTKREETPGLTKWLIENRAVRHVSFTGSSGVGKHIGRMSGENLKPCILELGGKSPVLVCDDADVEAAANAVLFHTFLNSGQICMSTERVITSAAVSSAFIESIKRQYPKAQQETLVSSVSALKIRDLVQKALDDGAKLAVGAESWPLKEELAAEGKFPTLILCDVTPSMAIWTEETFGPVSVVTKVEKQESDSATDEEMIRLANDSHYGLAASIFSEDLTRALRIGKRLEAGMIRINSGTVGDQPTVAFGGYKDTGFGRFNGAEGLRSYTQSKATSFSIAKGGLLPLHH